MPKLKTHKGTAKRVKVSAKNKLIVEHANKSHFKQKQSASRKRALNTPKVLKGATAKNVKRALGV